MARGKRLQERCITFLFSVCWFGLFYIGNVSSFSEDLEAGLPKSTSYDFIIVGGGTAGCVLANRLSANGKFSVLLLEAGGVPPEFMNVPALAKRNELMPELTFQYKSVPQKHAALGINGGVINISLGRVLGGTSQINYNVFNRGSPLDFDNWANITGDSSWAYANMLPFFKKSETYLGQFPSTIHHGFNGPIPVSTQKYAPGREAFLAAGQELGLQIKDPNGPQQISITPVEMSRLFGRRVSSYKGYIEPIVTSRGNLRIATNAYVTKVLFAGTSAIGVEYNHNGTYPQNGNVVFANREIILSAGTYGSATLLMRSGIGPRSVLQSAGIPVIKELPVGENLQEHPVVPIHIVLNNKSLSFDPATDLNPKTWEQFQIFGDGPYSSVAGYSVQAFLASSRAIKEGQAMWPDIHLMLTSVTTRSQLFQNNFVAPWETSVIMNIYLARQKSRGTVKLNPKDVNGTPLIDFNYLADPTDVEVFLEGIEATLALFEKTETYKRLGARIFREPLHGCRHLPFRSKSYWRCYIREATIPGNHPSSTCSMNAVVDSKLRVIGMNRINIVDAGIMPRISDTNLHAEVYAIAEKAADTILKGQAVPESPSSIITGSRLPWNELQLNKELNHWV